MNKYEEAYKRLSSRTYQYADKKGVYEDINVLGELVEKATPKKPRPLFLPMAHVPYKCPVCGYSVNFKNEKYNYCPNCGQKLDQGGFDEK